MARSLSQNTQAILLLTAPLIVGRGRPSCDLLKPREYQQLARHLRDLGRQPADLLTSEAAELRHTCKGIVAETRLDQLLGRGFLLSQAIEHWQQRSIWVISRADPDYPRRLKARLRDSAPAVIYGCGNRALLSSGGLAVVGSRHVDKTLLDYTAQVGQLAARAGRTIISGGAKGIDQAAMRGVLEGGGNAVGVLANNLERTAMQRDHRNLLRDERLVLVSPFDPGAGFNAGNAMSRNKLIYALADAALVVNADLKKGGTWAGAVEQLDKFGFVPVYLRSTGTQPSAFDALRLKGAMPWPNLADAESFEAIFNNTAETQVHAVAPDLFTRVCSEHEDTTRSGTSPDSVPMGACSKSATDAAARPEIGKPAQTDFEHISEGVTGVTPANRAFVNGSSPSAEQKMPPEEILFQGVRESLYQLLNEPMKSEDIANALHVAKGQTNIWLKRLVEDGMLEKHTHPVRYGIRQTSLL